MRILHVASELFPLLKTGGLADVLGALPAALNDAGSEARVLLPGFPAVLAGLQNPATVAELDSFYGHVRLLYGQTSAGLSLYVIDVPALYDRPGNPYHDAQHQPYADNIQRFALLGWMAAQLANGLDYFWRPEVVHAHDWHAGLAPAYLEALGRPAKSVFTIHNLAYQGLFPEQSLELIDLPEYFFDIHGIEYHGQLSFMKAGIFFADHVTTVSPTYAREITTAEQGCGLEGLLDSPDVPLTGIVNGVDELVWSPDTDALIVANYSASKPAGKAHCKTALQELCGLQLSAEKPIFAVVSRLTEQKGLHLILAGLKEITHQGGQFVLLGSGDKWMEDAFRKAAEADPANVAVKIGYDENFAHQVMAGADVIMVPSRYEPCGLTQLYGLKYGALPLVRRVGGLADTVVDVSLENLADASATGVVFDAFTEQGLRQGVRRMFALWARPKDWKSVRRTGMSQDLGWGTIAQQYQDLYSAL